MDISHKPKSKHPNAHTDLEIKHIRDLIRRNPNITLCELWYKLRLNYSYSRHIGSLYRVLRKLDIIKDINVKGTSKYTPKPYDTPKMIGEKWQIDVKFVPKICKVPELPKDKNFYQDKKYLDSIKNGDMKLELSDIEKKYSFTNVLKKILFSLWRKIAVILGNYYDH